MNKYMMNGSQCAVVLIQEKRRRVPLSEPSVGKLREEWTLDALQSPVIKPEGNTPLGRTHTEADGKRANIWPKKPKL